LEVKPEELLALLVAGMILAAYGVFVIDNFSGFIEDMTAQFKAKATSPFLGGREGQAYVVAALAGAVAQLLLWRRFAPAVYLAFYGAAYIMLAFAGQTAWYDFARPLGAYLCAVAAILSVAELPGRVSKAVASLLGIAAAAAMGYQAFRFEKPMSPAIWPRPSLLARDFLPRRELDRVRDFIRGLPPGTIVSFGHSGVEAFFFDDLDSAGVQWVYRGHSVTQALPFRRIDYLIRCDSALYPHFLFAYDPLIFTQSREGRDSGCMIMRMPPPLS
jgi:hypothetical protein